MESDQKNYYYSGSTCFYYYASDDHHAGPLNPAPTTTVSIPIHSLEGAPTPVPVRLPAAAAAAAVKIQSAYRGHLIRALVRRIRAVDAEAAAMELRIQRQEMVDDLRGEDDRVRLRVSEGLMALLLRLDSVPGFYPAVRELRRGASRRITALQEVLDAILAAPPVAVEGEIPASWDEIVERLWGNEEDEAVEERGFNCWEKFLQGVTGEKNLQLGDLPAKLADSFKKMHIAASDITLVDLGNESKLKQE